jgi:hypothetical protein
MPKVTKQKARQESSGEDFGNEEFSDSDAQSDNSESGIIPEDPWTPIVVDGKKKEDFVKVNDSTLLKMNEKRLLSELIGIKDG